MQRRVWSLEELTQILLATNEANANADFVLSTGSLSKESQAEVEAYRAGFKAALGSIALAIGIPGQNVMRRNHRDDAESRLLPHT